MLISLACSFVLLKLRDRVFGADLGSYQHSNEVDFDRKLLDAQESNLKQLQKDE
jgi:hypothetical protein